LGFATIVDRKFETLTQATFVEGLMPFVSADPKKDRDLLLRGQRLEKVRDAEARKLIFRNLFIDEKDTTIAKVVHNYFGAVREKWPGAWDFRGQGRILNKTNGFRALMRVLPRAYLYFGSPGDMISTEKFFELFRRVGVDDSYFTPERFKPGGSGEGDLFQFFNSKIF
jgi:hypothetical protein